MARDWYTPDELRDLNALDPCPFWQRMNPSGWCVEKWWAGGPVSSVVNGIAIVTGMAAVGALLVYASRIALLRPALQFIQTSRAQMKALENPTRWRTRRRRRRRR